MVISKCILLAWVVATNQSVAATALAEQVSTARAEVNSLAEQLENKRRETRDDLSGLRNERSELQRQIRLEQIRRDTLERLRNERIRRVGDQEGRILALLEPIQRSIAATKLYVGSALPFKRRERMRRLEQIEKEIAVTTPDAARALTQVWRFIEEEEALASEIALAQQAIELDGKQFLADVLRIGMALMYFRLPNQELGWVRQSGKEWRFERIQDPLAQKTVARLFKELENNRVLGPKKLLIPTDVPHSAERSHPQ